MARGGARRGTPGQPYGNRSDMRQAIKVAPGGEYGSRKALAQAQQAIPLPNNQVVPPPQAPSSPDVAAQMGAAPPAIPGQAGPFERPTERPNEPVTAGIPSGPGPGPEALTTVAQGAPDEIGAQLRAVYAAHPNDDLLRVIALHDQGR